MLPVHGMPAGEVAAALDTAARRDIDWRGGRHWSLVYDSPPWHARIVDDAARRFTHENAASHSAFPSAAAFESAVVDMAASVVSPDVPAHGSFTSGGTESILVAMRAYRDTTAGRRREVVVPVTAHPAFWKAANYLGLRIRLTSVTGDGRADPDALTAAIGDRTAMVGLSAPCFPYGVVDPVEQIAALAADRGVGVHVDASLGGLFLPFRDPPAAPFGLQVPGVTSISLDVHKYGYGLIGASVVLFATPELRRASYYVASGWPGGAYASPGVLGTRPVAPGAAAWASMIALGRHGYRDLVRQVMHTTRALRDGIVGTGRFRLLGEPDMSVFAVTCTGPDLPAVVAGMQRRQWWIDTLDDPPAMHFVVFPRHASVVDTFLDDLAAATAQASTMPADSLSASSYGVMVRDHDRTELGLCAYLDSRFDR